MDRQEAANISSTGTTDRRWTASNLLSLLRLVMALPAALALASGSRWTTVILCVLAAITDTLDGYVARRRGEISEFGKIIDPLADKVFVATIAMVMLAMGMIPLWFVLIILARDLLILAGGIAIERRTGVVLPSNYPGKIAVVALSATLLLIIAGVSGSVIDVMMGVSLALLGLSLGLYGLRLTNLTPRQKSRTND